MRYHGWMRTTLDVDDRVLESARALAQARHISLGAAVSELAQRGMQRSIEDGVFPTFHVEPGARPITPEMVREAMDE